MIESWVGFYLPISTMAGKNESFMRRFVFRCCIDLCFIYFLLAAGLGNAISDVAGIGLAHHIESFAMKFVNVQSLTAEQWNLSIVGWLSAISKSICIFIGCLIGMTPLLFMHHDNESSSKAPDKEENSSN